MTISPKKLKKEDHPSLRQALASDPMKSVWVGASAGTGKTKVLIDRVLRLMLPRSGLPAESATPPGKILCLTFTKTAAAEMSNRIYKRLSEWAVRSDAELKADLSNLIGEQPSPEVEKEARRLFARVLDTPGGLKIMTIHSFCQSVLKRFPIEAGLPPHFELMDEQSAVEYLTRCLHDIITDSKKNPAAALAQAFSLLALHLDSETMSDLMAKVMAERSLLTEILKAHGDAEGKAERTVKAIHSHLGLDENDSEEDLVQSIGDIPAEKETKLKKALDALLQGSKTDQEKAAGLQPWLEQKNKRHEFIGDYRKVFFTTENKIRKTLATKPVTVIYPDITDVMQEEAERLEKIENKLSHLRLAGLNAALLTVAAEMIGHYERHKRYTDRLDFDDLIIKTCSLLSDNSTVQWVLYKLDEGIDHILVDEAQDTSPYQWRVIKSLAGEFFAGSGSRENVQRTLFVVGDEKQSIFSFQGADPAEFARVQAFFGEKAQDIQDGWEIPLQHSFRSTRTVLEIVDSVFRIDSARKGVVADISRDIVHFSTRERQAGLVELWPLMRPQTRPEDENWKLPTEIEPGDNAASRLAAKIASTVKHWITHKEKLPAKGRPVRAGDILILVQSRGAFVEQMMRALKEAEVAVAGIDRMTLTEEIAVMDLVAAAQFALLPKDDLTLATVLKSPLIGLSEEDLYELCHARKSHLWDSLRHQQGDIASALSGWVEKAAKVTPYEFFAEILNTPCFADKTSGRRAFYARLGFDIQDALDEFLNSCLHYEQSHTPSLQKFINWFVRGEAEIKREQEQHKQDQVRIMTVHGAKGLQAPIVFLPDTVKKMHDHNKARIRLIWPDNEQGVPLWSPRTEFDVGIYAEKRDAAKERQEEEYRRLLYVALTRAEDRLYICGWRGRNEPKDNCWYNLVSSAFPREGIEDIPFDDGLAIRRLSHPQEVAPPPLKETTPQNIQGLPKEKLPGYALQLPRDEPFPSQPLSPSCPEEDEPATRGPLAEGHEWKFRRGIIVHQILEILPQLPENKWEKILNSYISRPALQIPEEERIAFIQEIKSLIYHTEFKDIFGKKSRAEVPLVGLAGKNGPTHVLSGKIDRLLVTDKEVLIVDYKTNRPPPKSEDAVPEVYLKQMAAYKSMIDKIYKGKTVRCALLWTDGPHLMPLSEKLLDRYML